MGTDTGGLPNAGINLAKEGNKKDEKYGQEIN